MRAVVQRVQQGKVTLQETGQVISEIGQGYVVLLGVGLEDNKADSSYLAEKIAHLRVFEDEAGKMNRSILDIGGEVLVVSQFTLYGDCRKGRRPSFTAAGKPDVADRLYEVFVQELKKWQVPVATGQFQTDMLVEIANDGPVTMLLDSKKLF